MRAVMSAGRLEGKQGTATVVPLLLDDEGLRDDQRITGEHAQGAHCQPKRWAIGQGLGVFHLQGTALVKDVLVGKIEGGREEEWTARTVVEGDDERGSMGRGAWDGERGQLPPMSRNRDAGRAGDVPHRDPREYQALWDDKPQIPTRGDAYETPSVQNYGTTNNIKNAENVFTGTNSGIIHMGPVTIESAEDFMTRLSDLLKICKRADHRYYAPDDEATLRRGQCTPGTHVNILQGVTNWATNMSPDGERVFWLSGQAGSGKTTIAYTIARHLEALWKDSNSKVALGASFFCSRQFPDTRSASSIIRTIVYQLARRSKPFQAALKEHGQFDSVDHGPRSQMMDLLITPWEKSASERLANEEPCFVIPIDALDELEGTGGTEFLGTLFDVVDQQDLSGLKFFVTSRSDPALVKRIESFPNKQVCRLEEVPLEESSADIKLFLSENLSQCATTQQIQQLVSDAAGLFIHAATVVKYLKGRGVEEQKSLLRRFLSSSSARRPSRAATATLDNLYLQILETSLVDPRERDDPEAFQECLAVLHTFVCTIERTSVSVAVDILNASGGDGDTLLDDGIANGVLDRLHAVLYSQGGQVMWYHKSFADFLFDEGRSQKFFCSQEKHHHRLADGCFGIMKKQLRFNIAEIPSSHQMDCNNPTLPASIERNISAPLRYACGNWSTHLTFTAIEARDHLTETLHKFLQLQVLFWMESMSLLGQRGRCQRMLRDVQRWSSKSKDSKDLVGKLTDAAAFSAYHSTGKAALSTPHLYMTSLATFPRRSVVVQNWRRHFSGIPGFISAYGVGSEGLVACITVKSSMIALAVSPGGVDVVVGSHDGLVTIWGLFTGEEIRVFKGHTSPVLAVAYSPDGTHVISGSIDESIRVWDLSTGEAARVLQGHTGLVVAVAYSPDGTRIISGSGDKSVRVWDSSNGEQVGIFKGHTDDVTALACSPDGTHVISSSRDNSIRVWNLSTGEEAQVLSGHARDGRILAMSYSSDGTHVVSGSQDGRVRLWNLSTGQEERVFMGHDSLVAAWAYSPDSAYVVSGYYHGEVGVWDLSTGEEVGNLKGHTSPVWAVSYLPDGVHVVSGSADKSIRVWELSRKEEVRAVHGHTHVLNALAYLPDGTRVVCGLGDQTVRVWDLSTGEEVLVLKGHTASVNAVACSPDGVHVVSGSEDTFIRVWDLSKGEEVGIFQGHTKSVLAVAYSPDGTHVVSGSRDKTMRIWDISTGEGAKVLTPSNEWVRAVSYSPDGTHVVAASTAIITMESSLQVWELSTGEVKALEQHNNPIFPFSYSPNETRIVYGSSDNSIRVWDVSTGEEVLVLEGHTSSIYAVTYSPDRTHVVSGSDDHSIRVWDLSTGEAVMVLKGHFDTVFAVAWSPDGTRVLSGGNDNSIRVWDVSPAHTPRYVHEQGPDEEHSGWLVSPTDPSAYLMFLQPEALRRLPDDTNTLTLPATVASHVDFSNARLGDRWTECYTPTL